MTKSSSHSRAGVAKAYPGEVLQIVCDNYAGNKHVKIDAWLEADPRGTIHTPTHASWLNPVEVFFSIAEGKAIQMGIFCSSPAD